MKHFWYDRGRRLKKCRRQLQRIKMFGNKNCRRPGTKIRRKNRRLSAIGNKMMIKIRVSPRFLRIQQNLSDSRDSPLNNTKSAKLQRCVTGRFGNHIPCRFIHRESDFANLRAIYKLCGLKAYDKTPAYHLTFPLPFQ